MTQLSENAKKALIDAGTNRQGAKVKGAHSELKRAGLIGEDCGLTRKGSIARERVLSAALDEAF